MNAEPVAVINVVVALIEAIIALAVGLGRVNLTKEQVGLLMAVVVAAANVLKTLWARGQVTPVTSPKNNQGQQLVPALAPARL
jgi:uncharacterized membrane protein